MTSKTIVCPYCGARFAMKVMANGRFICGECDETFEFDGIRIPPQRQHDAFSCGQKTAKWLMESFGLESPSDKNMQTALHVDKTESCPPLLRKLFFETLGLNEDDFKYTLPWTWQWYMSENGIDAELCKEDWQIKLLTHLQPENVNEILDSLDFDGHNRFAIVYATRKYGHWIGLEKHGTKWFVADPLKTTFISATRHEAIENECPLLLYRCRRNDDFPCVEL